MKTASTPAQHKLTAALAVVCFGFLLDHSSAQPVLNASTPDTFAETSEAIVEAAKSSGDLGPVDVARLQMALSGVLMNAMSYVLEKAGPNVAPSEAQRLASEKLQLYNGMTGAQFLQALQDAADAQEEAGNLAAKQRASKTQAILQAWLKGEKVPLGDGNSLIEYDVRGKERGNQTDIVDVYETSEGEKNRIFRGYLDETGEQLKRVHTSYLAEFSFCDFPVNTPVRLEEVLFWIPKYREWVSTTLNRPESERLPAFVKKLPSLPGDSETRVSPMWLLFNGDYETPQFFLLYGRHNDDRNAQIAPEKEAELLDRLKAGTLDEFLNWNPFAVLSPTEVKRFEDILLAFQKGKIQSQQRRQQAEASARATEDALQGERKAVDEALR